MSATVENHLSLGRQPILGKAGETVGYELLYRDGQSPGAASFIDGTRATATVLTNALVEFGLEKVVGDGYAFVNFPKPYLTGTLPIPLSNDQLVIEVLEDVEIDEHLVSGLRSLSERGYRIALDDFCYSPQWDPCLEVADIVKLDVLALSDVDLFENVMLLKKHGVVLLAEKVEGIETYRKCVKLGFDLFQGYFFAKPDLIEGKASPVNHASILSTLAAVSDPSCGADDIAAAVGRDATMTHKLVRLVNSSAFGLRRQVECPKDAIVMLGLDNVRSLVTMMMMTSIDSKPPALVRLALVRAVACQGIARARDPEHHATYFTAGLLSLLDAMLDRPMDQILAELPLTDELKAAIGVREGAIGKCLETVTRLEGSVPGPIAEENEEASLCFQAYRDAEVSVDAGDGIAGAIPRPHKVPGLDALLCGVTG